MLSRAPKKSSSPPHTSGDLSSDKHVTPPKLAMGFSSSSHHHRHHSSSFRRLARLRHCPSGSFWYNNCFSRRKDRKAGERRGEHERPRQRKDDSSQCRRHREVGSLRKRSGNVANDRGHGGEYPVAGIRGSPQKEPRLREEQAELHVAIAGPRRRHMVRDPARGRHHGARGYKLRPILFLLRATVPRCRKMPRRCASSLR